MEILQDSGSFEILAITDLVNIERAGRTCYQSAVGLPTEKSAEKFTEMIISRGHESVLEHSTMTVAFDGCSRGFTHELVRHRLASFSQESTRYVDYTRPDEIDLDRFELKVVCPPHKDPDEKLFVGEEGEYSFRDIANCIEGFYRGLRKAGWEPEDARQILPIGTRSRIVVTANFREWRHIFKLRTAPEAHWEIRSVMTKLMHEARGKVPVVFDEI